MGVKRTAPVGLCHILGKVIRVEVEIQVKFQFKILNPNLRSEQDYRKSYKI